MVSLPKRIRDKISFQHSNDSNRTACWMWTGHIDSEGYAITTDGSERVPARRFVYQKLRGPIPGTHQLRCTCPHRACVNPNHVEIRGQR